MTEVPHGTDGTPADGADRPRSGGVQSLERAFGLLELVAAQRRSMSLSELASASGLAPATLHRLARTLVDLGYRDAGDRIGEIEQFLDSSGALAKATRRRKPGKPRVVALRP